MSNTLLRVENLKTHFLLDGAEARAVDGLSFEVRRGETLALVGESGCGKTVAGLSILGLVPPPGRICGGRVLLEGEDLLDLGGEELRRVRGRRISMVFQDPASSYNPVLSVGRQIVEALRVHTALSPAEARQGAIRLLGRVAVPSPELRVDAYPHQLSTGLKQRALLAMALACEPLLLIADEPTTSLDVTVQAEVLRLIRSLQKESGMSVLFITHDMGVVAEVADRVLVMYAGRCVEEGEVREVFDAPRHPYTLGLFESQLRIRKGKGRLQPIPGQVPDPMAYPPGCRFHPRCALAVEACREEAPALEDVGGGHLAACLRLEKGELPPWPTPPEGAGE
jgi:peptide/nickel transport system ATP-binding protein/oligopeptide transport system ATP-binding protein